MAMVQIKVMESRSWTGWESEGRGSSRAARCQTRRLLNWIGNKKLQLSCVWITASWIFMDSEMFIHGLVLDS